MWDKSITLYAKSENKYVDGSRGLGYSGIMNKLFIADGQTYEFKNMEEANKKLDLPQGAWFEHQDDNNIPEGTHVWRL